MSRKLNNTILIKAVEEIDENAAIEMMSNSNLDEQELSEVLNAHFCKEIKDKETEIPLQLSNKVVMTGIRNRLNRFVNDSEK